jgi:predicted SAM-dependent methyltransferase
MKGSMSWINKDKCQPHMKLDIGSGNPDDGENQPEGYVLNDIEKHKNIDLVCNIKHLADHIPQGYCSEIRASHILEHFGTHEVKDIIRMVHGLLEDDGKFTIFVPNFRWHSELMMTGNDEMAVHYAFGGQTDEYDYHKTGFTPKILEKCLLENGFVVDKLTDDTSIECQARKIG